MTQTNPRDIPDIMNSKKWREGGGTFGVMVLVIPSHCYLCWGPATLEVQNTSLPVGRLNEFLGFLGLYVQFLLSLLNWPSLNP